MSERPIPFSGPMVRAILDGRKTQMRRVVKPQPAYSGIEKFIEVEDPWHNDALAGTPAEGMGRSGERRRLWYAEDWCGNLVGELGMCPYGAPGDRLWVRETWQCVEVDNDTVLVWRASCDDDKFNFVHGDGAISQLVVDRWSPSIHMPRGASRITLEVTDVRVERAQAISEADARAEGCSAMESQYGVEHDAREDFALLWDSLNAKRAPWESNPWVWVVSFKRVAP